MSDAFRDATPDELRTYLALERTLLAWIRTGLALTGFGFLVARFGLFLRQLAVIRNEPPDSPTGLSLWIGTALVLVGVGVNLFAARQYASMLSRFQGTELARGSRSAFQLGLTLLLAILGLLMAVYLIVLS